MTAHNRIDSAETILIPLAEGFEEIEAVALIDILRRADLSVTTAGLADRRVLGAHGIALEADTTLAELDSGAIGAIVLPGGMPGTRYLAADERLLDLIRRLHAAGRTTAAICAAPLVLQAAGVVGEAAVTCHPSVTAELAAPGHTAAERVVEAGPLLTSRGPGTAPGFALALVERFRDTATADKLAAAMLVEAHSR